MLKAEPSIDPRNVVVQVESDLWMPTPSNAMVPLPPAQPLEITCNNPFRRRMRPRILRKLDPAQMRGMTPEQLLVHLEDVLRHSTEPPSFSLRDFLRNLPTEWHSDDRIIAALEASVKADWTDALNELLETLEPSVLHSHKFVEAAQRALETAVVDGHGESAVVLLRRGGAKLSVQQRSRSGMTLLMLASWHGHETALQCLLKQGAIVDARDPGGRSALHFAAVGGHLGTVRLLLAAGADVEAQDRDGWTPMVDAEQNGHITVCEELKQHREKLNRPLTYEPSKKFRALEDALSFSDSATPRAWAKPLKDPMQGKLELLLNRKTYQETLDLLS